MMVVIEAGYWASSKLDVTGLGMAASSGFQGGAWTDFWFDYNRFTSAWLSEKLLHRKRCVRSTKQSPNNHIRTPATCHNLPLHIIQLLRRL